ncbi:hypothetical protein RF074_20360, partial [Serratia marcescens]|uniref:hypothetical protein n=1 Tax=Serratia marcescens TaxID=615 RepID=UPI002812B51E
DIGIMVGYSLTSKAYRVYNKCTLTVEESAHVKFDESTEAVHQASMNNLLKQTEKLSVLNDDY